MGTCKGTGKVKGKDLKPEVVDKIFDEKKVDEKVDKVDEKGNEFAIASDKASRELRRVLDSFNEDRRLHYQEIEIHARIVASLAAAHRLADA